MQLKTPQNIDKCQRSWPSPTEGGTEPIPVMGGDLLRSIFQDSTTTLRNVRTLAQMQRLDRPQPAAKVTFRLRLIYVIA